MPASIAETDDIKPYLAECDNGYLLISRHAILQFIMRWQIRYHSEILDPVSKIVELFNKSEPENLQRGIRFKRLINNFGREAKYYYFDGWRFVAEKSAITTQLGIIVLMTIEIDKFGFQNSVKRKDSQPMPRRFKKKPQKIRRKGKRRYIKHGHPEI